jgi:hypothetical protein
MLMASIINHVEGDGGTLRYIYVSPFERESDTRFSTSGFLHESVSPGPLRIPLGPFRKKTEAENLVADSF